MDEKPMIGIMTFHDEGEPVTYNSCPIYSGPFTGQAKQDRLRSMVARRISRAREARGFPPISAEDITELRPLKAKDVNSPDLQGGGFVYILIRDLENAK